MSIRDPSAAPHGNGSTAQPDAQSTNNGSSAHEEREHLWFDALFRCYRDRLCAFASSYVQSSDVAEELVNDVFLRIWERRSSWHNCVNARRYLYAAVRNRALKHIAHERVVRRSHAMAQNNGYSPAMSQPPRAPDDLVYGEELANALERAIERLPSRCQQAYTLHRADKMRYGEIAVVMGTSVRTVETQILRAREAFRRVLVPWLT